MPDDDATTTTTAVLAARAPAAARPPVIGDQRLVKHINRMALLRLLRGESGLSRADLAQRSGLTRSTVGALIKELIDEGWLEEAAAAAAARAGGGRGRRPTPLGLDSHRLLLVGAELGPDAICAVTTSIRGEVLDMQMAPLRSTDPNQACRQLVQMITALSSRVVQGGARLLGIGVAMPGAVDMRSGRLQFAPNIGWRNLAVGPLLDAELASAGFDGVPVYFHNEADLAAVGEIEFGARPAGEPLVYVSCGVGVGAGIMLKEGLFTGATGAAGEIGHNTLVIAGAPCSCGRLGCAEAYIGLRAIAAAADCLHGGAIDRAALRVRMGSRHPATRAAFAQAGRALGVLLQNIWTTLNPTAMVLGGETVALGGETFLDAAAGTLDEVARRAGVAPPELRLGRHAERAAAVGGAGYVLHAILNPNQPALHTPYHP